MKNILKILLRVNAKLIAFFLHRNIVRIISIIATYITSEYIAKQLKKCGKNPIIGFPITSHGLQNISIGDNFHAFARLRLEAYDEHNGHLYAPEIVIGDNVGINYDCHIACINKIIIGNNVLMGSKVLITDHFHGDTTLESLSESPNSRKLISKGAVIIEDNVWIGEGVVIMPNVTIGSNSVIGANSVVTKEIPPFCIAVGAPAKPIKLGIL